MKEMDVQNFRSLLRRIERSLVENLKGESICCGISFNECHVLLELDGKPSTAVSSLSGALGMDKSMVSRTVDALVQRGMLNRLEDPDDRRRKSIALTAEGERLAEWINGQMNGKYRELFAALDTDTARELTGAARLLAETLELWKDELSAASVCCREAGE